MWLRFYKEDKVAVSIIDSIPHCHTENALKRRKQRNVDSFLCRGQTLEYLSSKIFHTVIPKCFERSKKEMWRRFYKEDKVGVSIIDRTPHCNTDNTLKYDKNQEMWTKLEYLSSIVFHTVIQKMLRR